jgi:hypothetical protein
VPTAAAAAAAYEKKGGCSKMLQAFFCRSENMSLIDIPYPIKLKKSS